MPNAGLREAFWYGTKVSILRYVDRFWVVVRFMESCPHHSRGEEVCMSNTRLVVRDPMPRRRQPLRRVDKAPCTRYIRNYDLREVLSGKAKFEWLRHPDMDMYLVFDDTHLGVAFVSERGEFRYGIGYYRDNDPKFDKAIVDAIKASKPMPGYPMMDGFAYPTEAQMLQLASLVV